MVHLAKAFAGIVFVGLIALSAMFAVLAVAMLTRRLVFPRVLEVSDDAILFPHGFPRTRITRIPFTDILLPWLLLNLFQLPTISVAGFLCLAIPVALFFTSLHWLNSTHPARATRISFRDRGITQLSGKQTRDLNYDECSGWEVVERRFEEHVLHILLLQWRNHVIEVALPDANTRDRLAQIFRDKQIPHSPDLKPSWESHA
jgi:hypothetical protein